MAAEERYYIVVSGRRTTLSCVAFALVALVTTTVWGQGPKPEDIKPTPLVPAEPAWSISLEASPAAGPVLDAVHVYVPLRNERLVAITRADGQVAWARDLESATTPAVGEGIVYVLASDEIHAIDAATGEQRWRVSFSSHADVALTLVADRLVGVVEPSTVVALSATDGSTLWQRELPSPPAHPAVGADGRLYIASSDGRVTALSASDGSVLWQRGLDGTPAQPALAGDKLIVGTVANEFYALDTQRGTIAWRWRVGGDAIGGVGSDGTVFVTALDNLLRAVDQRSGNQRWKRSIASRPAQPPQAFGNLVVVTSAAPTVSIYSARTGMPVGTYVAPGEIEGSALVAAATDGSGVVMVIVMRDGRVVGLRPKPPEPAKPAPPEPDPGAPVPGQPTVGQSPTGITAPEPPQPLPPPQP